ncbi:MAG: transketolase C-terminal domain-containing protein [Candidatus Paceibacterota bacterium]
MLNSKLNLSSKTLEDDVSKTPIRNGYGEGLVEAGKKNDNVVVLSADLMESTRAHLFAKEFPDRFFEMGVAEQNMATVAAGLGIAGKIPFISSYATFSPGRNWEQIRTTISYNDSNVKIAGHHAGISTGPDGATHQAIEDIATMRVMANMKVFVPCDYNEAKKVTIAAADMWGPVYIRCARAATPVITTEKTKFSPGKAEVFWKSKKPEVLIIACGTMVHTSLMAAKELEKEGIKTVVLNNHTIKPLDEKTIISLAKKTKAVVTAEEHSVIGGMGSAVSELLAKKYPVPIEFIGMQDTFGESGSPEDLIKKYKMDIPDIKKAVKKVIKRK